MTNFQFVVSVWNGHKTTEYTGVRLTAAYHDKFVIYFVDYVKPAVYLDLTPQIMITVWRGKD